MQQVLGLGWLVEKKKHYIDEADKFGKFVIHCGSLFLAVTMAVSCSWFVKSVGIFSLLYSDLFVSVVILRLSYQKPYRFVAFVLRQMCIKLWRVLIFNSDLDFLVIQQAEGIVSLGNSLEGLFFRRKCENKSEMPRTTWLFFSTAVSICFLDPGFCQINLY